MRLVFLVSLLPALFAQWLHYPTAGVPRNADGSVSRSAPAPKTPQGKPDFSGIWTAERNRPCPPGGCNDMELGQEFQDIGWSLPTGLPFEPWARDLTKSRIARNGMDDPGSHCRPVGFVKMHTSPFYRKIVQLPDLMLFLTERDAEHRQIFLDGRALPDDPQPAVGGYSTGHWEGDTLVISSAGFADGMWLDRNGSPLTDAGKITERFRRPNFGHLEITLTVDDPKAYTAPWTVTLRQDIAVDTDLVNYYCMENEKDSGHLVAQ